MRMRSALAFPVAFLVLAMTACDSEYRALGPAQDGRTSFFADLSQSQIRALMTEAALHGGGYEVISQEGEDATCAMTTFNGGVDWAPVGHIEELGATFPEWFTVSWGPFDNNPSPPSVALWQAPVGEVLFDEPVSSVDFFYSSSPEMHVEAFDAAGNVVASASGQANANGMFDEWAPLALDADGNAIVRVAINVPDFEAAVDDFRVCRSAFTEPTALDLEVQVRPGGNQPLVNRRSRGIVPVAIFSTEHFSAPDELEPASLAFGRSGDEPSLNLLNGGQPHCRARDVNGNGLEDLVCHFRSEETGFSLWDNEGVVTGLTRAGVRAKGRAPVRVIF